MRKIILIAPRCSPFQENGITEFVKTRAAWWHWSADTWLMKYSEEVEMEHLRNEIRNAFPGLQFMVLGFPDNPHVWAGFGIDAWQKWFNDVWSR
jgi:hypothetical protein